MSGSSRDMTEEGQAQAALLEAQAVIQLAMEGISKLDEAGRYLFVNTQYAAMLGYSPEELLGQSWEIAVHPDERVGLSAMREQMRATGRGEGEIRSLRKDGSVIRTQVVIVRPSMAQGDISGHYCFMQHSTARTPTDAFLDSVLEHVPHMVFVKDAETLRFVHFNKAGEELLGHRREDLLGKSDYDFFPKAEADFFTAKDREVLAAGRMMDIPGEPIHTKDQGLRFLRTKKIPLCDTDGTPRYLVGIAEDITEQKLAEDMLRANEARQEFLLSATPAVIYSCRASGDYGATFVSENIVDVMGYRREECLADSRWWIDRLHPDDRVRVLAELPRLFEYGSHVHEYRFRHKDGTYRWMHDELRVVYDAEKRPAELVGYWIDVTERRRMEGKLSRTQFAMDHAVDAVYWVDSQARIVYTNEAASAMLGYTADEFLRMTVHDVNPSFPPEVWPGWWEETKAKKTVSLETNHLSKDGRLIPIDIRVSFLAHEGQEFHCAFVRDLSEQKQAEEEQRRMRMLLTYLINTTPDFVFVKDRELRTILCNNVFARAVGKEPGELIGHTDIENGWDPELVRGNPDKGIRGFEQDDREALSGQVVHNMNDPANVGGTIRTFDTFKVPLRDDAGHIQGLLGISRDVTERKRMEDALSALAHGIGTVTGEAFFPRFVKELAAALGVKYAAVSDVSAEYPVRATIRAMWSGSEWARPFDYAVAGSPCELVVRDGFACYPSAVQRLFPDDVDLATCQAESYLGLLLRAESGTVLGHVFVIDDKPLADPPQATAVLRIFAARAAAELERLRADEALRASQERFELAVHATNDGIWDWNIVTGEVYWSDRTFELLGVKPGEVTPSYETWVSLIHPDDVDPYQRSVLRHLERGESCDLELRVRVKNVGYRWIRGRGQAVRDTTGRPVRMVGSIADVTARRVAEEALNVSQERFEMVARATTDGIWDWNIVTGDVYWADRTNQLMGGDPGESVVTYETWIAVVHPDDRDRAHHAVLRHLDRSAPYDLELRVRRKDGAYRWFRAQGQAIWDSTGRPVRMVGSLSDVTDRKYAEDALRVAHAELEQRVLARTHELAAANRYLEAEIFERKLTEKALRLTQFTVDRAAHGILWVNRNAGIAYVNDEACRLLEYSRDELLRMTMYDIDPSFLPEAWDTHWEELKRRGTFTLESAQRTRSGRVCYTDVTVNYLEYERLEYNCVIMRDITERKVAEEAARESELRYKLLIDATFDGIAVHDQGVLLEVNPGLERMFGYQPGELIGRSIFDLIAEESRALVIANMRAGVRGPYEGFGRRKDGTTFPGEVVVRPYRYRGKDVRLVAGRDITSRKHLEMERLQYTEELERQVTERSAEIAKLEARRAQTEKLAAMGRLAAGVAHEINNPMAGIKNAFALVRLAVDPAHPNAEFAGLIDREIARVAGIIQHMYQLYQPASRSVEKMDLWAMVKDLDLLLTPRFQQRRLKFVVDMGRCAKWMYVSRGDLLQVLLNLLTNAVDYSPEGGTITFSLREDGEWVRLAVSDQGPGIAQEHLSQIFDPFFTTKTDRDQKGMGLGLSISQSLVQAMGGKIEVDTQLHHGTTFFVLFPRQLVEERGSDQANLIKEVATHDG